MKKIKKKEESHKVQSSEIAQPILAAWQWKVVAVGVLIVASGFWVLSLSDPAGRNWASHAAPVLILGGYAVIAIVLWKR